MNLIGMIPLTKDTLQNDELCNSMTLWEIHNPNGSLMWDICMKMDQLKKILEYDHKPKIESFKDYIWNTII